MSIKEAFIKFSEEIGLTIVPEDDGVSERFHMRIDGNSATLEGLAVPDEEGASFIFYVNLGVKVPDEKKPEISQLLLMKNFELRYCGYFIEPETSLVLIRCTVPVYGSDNDVYELVKATVFQAASVADNGYNEIVKAILD